MPNSLDEELLEQEAEEEDQQPSQEEVDQYILEQEIEEYNQQQRLAEIQKQKQAGSADKAKKTKKWYGRYKKAGIVLEFLGASFPVWGPIVLVLGGALLVIVIMIVGCNQTGLTGLVTRAASKFFPIDVCKQLAFNGGTSGGGGGGASFAWEPADLVALSGVSVDSQTSDPRVRQCMLGKVQQIVGAAASAGVQVTITSAFRSGDFPSRHAFGEAVDISIRPPPSQPWSSNPQIAKLVQIAKGAGFNPPPGDTIDEYNHPVERTSGGHVHVEFNKISADGSYCAPYPNPPAPS